LNAGLDASKKKITDKNENQPILDLHVVYTLFERVNQLDQLRMKFAELVKQNGLEMVSI
jgi:hypothetical protein